MDHLGHPEDTLVVLDPLVHPAELHVPDDVVDRLEPDTCISSRLARHRGVTGLERARVVAPVDEGVDRVAVGGDGGELDRAELILEGARLEGPSGAALHGLPVRLGRIGHRERDVLDAVTVAAAVPRDVVVLAQRRRQHEADASLLEHVRGSVAYPGLRACVGSAGESQCLLVEVRGLLGVADPQLDVVPPVEWHEIRLYRNWSFSAFGRRPLPLPQLTET